MPKWIVLWTDMALWFFVALLVITVFYILKRPYLQRPWEKIWSAPSAVVSAVILTFFLLIALVDSIHYRPILRDNETNAPVLLNGETLYQPVTLSVLDHLLTQMRTQKEISYSAPFATKLFAKKTMTVDGKVVRDFPRLSYGGAHLSDHDSHGWDLFTKLMVALALGVGLFISIFAVYSCGRILKDRITVRQCLIDPWSTSARRAFWLIVAILCVLSLAACYLSSYYHVFGTDATGNSVLYQALKGVRTAMVIGILATLVSLPFAIVLGLLAGYYRRWVDDMIQYVYSLISSVPTVLLMAASVLMLQVYLDKNTTSYATGIERADVRLFAICCIIGLTAWVGLCRLLRAETLKLREVEYVKAAQAFGVPAWKILANHILPNVMHLVLVVAVLEFSGLVLFEAVLSYLGIGVDPQMNSFGAMINIARIEVLRDPMIWWNIAAAFSFLLAIVLSANILADHVRRVFDPRASVGQASWLKKRLYTKNLPQVQPVSVTQHSCG